MDELLRERALAFARRGQQASGEATGAPYLVFSLQSERYALPLSQLSGVVKVDRLTAVPGASSELVGLLNVRGEVHPLYDLGRLLGRDQDSGWSGITFAVLGSLGGLSLGLRVENVLELMRVRQVELQVSGAFAVGRTTCGVTLLDLNLFAGHPLFREDLE